ncbi:transposase [Streptomyces sp. NPDC007901]|uniref:transposase n=1 Tax=Streptomyces sp. NPDC007901 TaxID=3364785 RepID=UPI0036EB9773
MQQVQAVADAEGSINWDISVDSTVMRAHQHAAGARKAPPPAVSKGAMATGHQIDPAWTGLLGRPEEVVLHMRAWAARAADSPPRST